MHSFHKGVPFLPERMKIVKFEKLVTNLYDKKEYVIDIRNLNQALVLKKMYRVIKFNQETWLKSYIDMNKELRKKAKNDFENLFFKLMNNVVFRQTIENVRKYICIKLVTAETTKNYLVSEPNYH